MIEVGSLRPNNSYTYSVPELGAHYALCADQLMTCDLRGGMWGKLNQDMTEIAKDFIARGLVKKLVLRIIDEQLDALCEQARAAEAAGLTTY